MHGRKNIKLFTYIMNNGGPRAYPWGTSCLNLPQSKKKVLVVFGDFTFNFLSPGS